MTKLLNRLLDIILFLVIVIIILVVYLLNHWYKIQGELAKEKTFDKNQMSTTSGHLVTTPNVPLYL